MDNGCPECKKRTDNKLCDLCELDMLQATAEAAARDYIDKANEIMRNLRKTLQGRAGEARLAHNQEVAGSNPAPAIDGYFLQVDIKGRREIV